MMTNEQRERRRQLICDWLTANGIDPNRVPVNSPLSCNVDETQLRYEEYVLDEDGKVMLGKDLGAARVEKVAALSVPPPAELREMAQWT